MGKAWEGRKEVGGPGAFGDFGSSYDVCGNWLKNERQLLGNNLW